MSPTVDQRIVAVAAANGGACTAVQLRQVGVGDTSIQRRVKVGFLRQLGRGLFAVPSVAGPRTALHAAQLALPSAIAVRATAARLHGMKVPHTHVTVGVPGRTKISIEGVQVLRMRALETEKAEVIDGLRATALPRTLFDVAAHANRSLARHLMEQQFILRKPSAEDFGVWLATTSGQGMTGRPMVTLLLDELTDDQPFAESKLEQLLWNALVSCGIEGIRRQARPPWYDGVRGVVDFMDTLSPTIIEADGRSSRQTTAAHDNDRRRDQIASAAGHLVIRVTWTQLARERAGTMERIAATLATRR